MKRSKLKTLWRTAYLSVAIPLAVWAGCWDEPKFTRHEVKIIGRRELSEPAIRRMMDQRDEDSLTRDELLLENKKLIEALEAASDFIERLPIMCGGIFNQIQGAISNHKGETP